MLCSIAAICLDVVGFGVMGIIMLVCMLGIYLGCYVDEIKDQNKELKNELYTVNKKLDKLIKRLEE
jgi:uncharacterized membrane protein